jgi:tryptophan-rich sensory protein
MGGAHYLVTKETGTWLHWPYIIQLLLNLAWQPIFFLLKMPGVAQLENIGRSEAP